MRGKRMFLSASTSTRAAGAAPRQEGGRLAGCIQNQLLWGLCPYDCGYIDRGVKAHPSFCVLRNTDMPAVLVEVGFIDSDDVGVLTQQGDEIARALARGVTDYWQRRS